MHDAYLLPDLFCPLFVLFGRVNRRRLVLALFLDELACSQAMPHSGVCFGSVGALMAVCGSSSLDLAHPWMGHDSGDVGCMRGGSVKSLKSLLVVILFYRIIYLFTYCYLFIDFHALHLGVVSVMRFEVVLLCVLFHMLCVELPLC